MYGSSLTSLETTWHAQYSNETPERHNKKGALGSPCSASGAMINSASDLPHRGPNSGHMWLSGGFRHAVPWKPLPRGCWVTVWRKARNLPWPAPQPSPICLPAASSTGLTLRNIMEGGRYLCGTGLDVERNGWFRSSDVFVPDGGSTSSCSGIS